MRRSPVVLAQAVSALTVNRGRVVVAVAGLAACDALLVNGSTSGTLGWGTRITGTLLLATLAAAAANATDPRQLRAAAVLDLVGATRWQRREVVVVETFLLALIALPVGLAAGLLVAVVAGRGLDSLLYATASALAVPTAVALVAGRSRTMVTAVDARGAPRADPARPTGQVRVMLRIAVGAALIGAGYATVSGSTSWFDLDLLLWPALVLAAIGLALLAPLLLDQTASLLGALPSLTAHLGGRLLWARRKLVTPTVVLGTVGAFVVAVHAMLGAGLAAREQERRAHVVDRYRFTAGLHPDEVIVQRSAAVPPTWLISDRTMAETLARMGALGLPEHAPARVLTRVPDAAVAPIDLLPASVRADPLVPHPNGLLVAEATPQLLDALGLPSLMADVEAGRAIALDPSTVVDGRVSIVEPAEGGAGDGHSVASSVLTTSSGSGDDDDASSIRELPAVVAQPGRIATQLPAVLVRRDLVPPAPSSPDLPAGPDGLVVRLDRPATDADAWAITSIVASGDSGSFPITARRGGESMNRVFDDGRLDASDTVGIRTSSEAWAAMALVAVATLVGLLVTLRLATVTRRADEEVVELVGAVPRTLRRLAALQASVLAGVPTTIGLTLGIALTRWGVARYNGGGRLGNGPGGTDLPPIPIVVPSALWVALVVVPVAAGVVGWILALRRPPLGPASIADGLLW